MSQICTWHDLSYYYQSLKTSQIIAWFEPGRAMIVSCKLYKFHCNEATISLNFHLRIINALQPDMTPRSKSHARHTELFPNSTFPNWTSKIPNFFSKFQHKVIPIWDDTQQLCDLDDSKVLKPLPAIFKFCSGRLKRISSILSRFWKRKAKNIGLLSICCRYARGKSLAKLSYNKFFHNFIIFLIRSAIYGDRETILDIVFTYLQYRCYCDAVCMLDEKRNRNDFWKTWLRTYLGHHTLVSLRPKYVCGMTWYAIDGSAWANMNLS